MKESERLAMDIYEKMSEQGITLPEAPTKGGLYCLAKQFGQGFVYISGCGPKINTDVKGCLGKELSIEQGQLYARNCMLNVLAVLQAEIGDLRKIKNVVKITTFVQSTDDFYKQPEVANGGTQLLMDLLGAQCLPSRSAIGVNALPGNIPVETEALFEIYI